jgi:hypothetical protein
MTLRHFIAFALACVVGWILHATLQKIREHRRQQKARLERVRQICAYAGVPTYDDDTYETIAVRYKQALDAWRAPTGRPVGISQADYERALAEGKGGSA